MERLGSAHQAASSNECNPENGSSTEPDRQKTPVVILCGDFNDSPTSSACQVRPRGMAAGMTAVNGI